jgi:hypothetical protein
MLARDFIEHSRIYYCTEVHQRNRVGYYPKNDIPSYSQKWSFIGDRDVGREFALFTLEKSPETISWNLLSEKL